MKKIIPLVLLFVGLLVLGGVFLFLRGKSKDTADFDTEEEVAEVELAKRPVATLIPSSDGHWLKLRIEKIVIEAKTLDYELLYKVADGRTQGVPGVIELGSEKDIERDLLLGSESSGKFRYDEGVERGTLTLRFRNDKGKLVAKFSTEFHLQTETDILNSLDNEFSYQLNEESSQYFITMETFGLPQDFDGAVLRGPYGAFSSATSSLEGVAIFNEGSIYIWSADGWQELNNGESGDLGIFISS